MIENPYEKALSVIKNYWERIAESKEENVMGGDPACLSKLDDWLHELLGKGCPKSLFFNENELEIDKIYPKVFFDKNFPEFITIELQTILPDAPEVKAILPLLVTGYIMSRRRNSEESRCGNNMSKLFVALKNGLEDEIDNCKEKCTSYFRIRCWKKMFPKVTYTQLSKHRMKKSLPYFGMVNLFLFLAYKMRKTCNLTLSCQLFEAFAGYPGFCDKFFPRLKVKTALHMKNDPLKKEISLYLKDLYIKRASYSEIASESTGEWDDGIDRLEKMMEGVYDKVYEERYETCTSGELKVIMKQEENESGSAGTPLDMALDRYIMFFIDATIQRDQWKGKIRQGGEEEYLSKSEWAKEIWTDKVLMFFRD